jgi:hypothetical protein
LLLASYAIHIQTSWLMWTIYWLHIWCRRIYLPSNLWRFENIWEIRVVYCTMRRLSKVGRNKNCYCHRSQLPYGQIGYRILSIDYILVLWQPIIISVCGDLKIFQYSGEYSIVLWGDSPKWQGIMFFIAIVHNCHTDKLATEYYQ